MQMPFIDDNRPVVTLNIKNWFQHILMWQLWKLEFLIAYYENGCSMQICLFDDQASLNLMELFVM